MADRRVRKTKSAIRKAYFELVEERGCARIPISELARRADIDRKTFYLHYETISDIVKELAHEKIDILMEVLAHNGFFDSPFDTNVLNTALAGVIEEDISLFRSVAAGELWDFLWRDIQDVLVEAMSDAYADAFDLSPWQFKICARYIAAGCVAACRAGLESGECTTEELTQVIGMVAYRGIQAIMDNNSN